jgi:hypothetical protein
VTPAERLDLIKRIRPVLGEMTFAEVEIHLDEFGVDYQRWRYYDGDSVEWLMQCMRSMTDDQMTGISQYVLDETPLAKDESSWRAGEFRVFLSHLAAHKLFASELSDALKTYGMHGFVAHEHIEPGKAWENVILSSLATCDCLVAILHPDFHKSNWTDQEVGYVLGRGKLALAVKAGIDPYGFMGRLQAIPLPLGTSGATMAHKLVRLLCAHEETGHAARQSLIEKLVSSRSWNTSNLIAGVLKESPKITKPQFLQLYEARKANGEISGAYIADPWIDELVITFGEPVPAKPEPYYGGDEEPF